jgi:predicted DNA-binding transcriptional regulator AlpA
VTLPRLIRFSDLVQAGIIAKGDWKHLRRLQIELGFPFGFLISKGRRVWDEAEVEAWVQSRREGGK